MSTLNGRPNNALLVIDVQNDVMAGTHNREGVLANIAALVDKARTEDVLIVWVQHNDDNLPKGSEGWQYVAELKQGEDEPVVDKQWSDAFEESDLEAVLAERRVGHVFLAGAQTDECIRGTLHSAVVRGYDATLVADAHTTEDLREWGAPSPDKVIDHTNLYWGNHSAPGRKGGTVTIDSVSFR